MALYAYRHVIANERTCYWLLHRLRWPHGVSCQHCRGSEVDNQTNSYLKHQF